MAEYSLPKWLREEMEHDIPLRKVVLEGERMNAPHAACLQAVIGMLLERQKFLFIELARYKRAHGDLPPLDLTGSQVETEVPPDGYGTERDNDESSHEEEEGKAESEQPSGTFTPRRIIYGENGASDK